MKDLITLGVLLLASVVLATPITRGPEEISPLVEIEEYVQLDDKKHRWSLVPDGDGKMHLIDLNPYETNPGVVEPLWNAENDVFFVLCTLRNWDGARVGINADEIRNNGFNPDAPVRFIIHGWNNYHGSDVNVNIRNAYLTRGDYNVFVVDWGVGAQTIDYAAARWRIESVGTIVARLIDHMVQNGLTNHEKISVIGHSLGGHAAGFTGKKVTSGKVRTIIGLDPAGPLFFNGSPNERINYDDAEYVEILHTNGWSVGYGDPLGHSDFYPNYGASQPGCGIDLTGTCSHSRSHAFFAESINNNNFIAIRCADYNEIWWGRCTEQSAGYRMGGEPPNHGLSGFFYLTTNSNSPFARG